MKNRNKILAGSMLMMGLLLILTNSCKKDNTINNPYEPKKVVEISINASTGGTLITEDSIKLTIPPGALPNDGVVSVGRTGNEPTSVPNINLGIVDLPITIQLPTDVINKPLILSFPISSNISVDDNLIVLNNGTSYIPLEYSIGNKQINITIDKVTWENSLKNGKSVFSTAFILILIYEQTPPLSQIGLKKATFQSGTMNFDTTTANSNSKILLFVHGWSGRATTWKKMLMQFQDEKPINYTEYWTFAYNSSWSISHNAEILANLINSRAKGAQIDIVAHSMGGLVSRSMIETFGGDKYINKLITIGTPHQGTPLAALRKFGELMVKNNLIDFVIYNIFSHGIRDLDPTSNYIGEMIKLQKPPVSVQYYLIAAKSNPKWYDLIYGDDDGVVGVSSALGVPGCIFPASPPFECTHTEMPEYRPIYDQIVNYLKIVPNDIPLVSTASTTDITSTSAIIGGNVTSDGGTAVIDRGVYWGTSPNPESTGIKLQINSGTGAFTTSLSGLIPNTQYYFKAYASNSVGTGYGDEASFTTLNNPGETVTDIDGNLYHTVAIGTQVWMVENLKTTKYNDGTSIPMVTGNSEWKALSTPAYCWYNNDEASYKDTYGALYNYYAALSNKLCPTGWHVPTVDDWTTLTTFLGGTSIAGGKMKETGTIHWNSPNSGATNTTGFTGLPGGMRSDALGTFGSIGVTGYYWGVGSGLKILYLYYNDDNASGTSFFNQAGLSVRCIKN